MAGKITSFLRELQLFFSIILTAVGFVIFFIGIIGTFTLDWFKNFLSFLSTDFWLWSPYFLIIGFIVFAFGVWYLYSFLKNRKFILDEIKTNKRSELLKKHGELKSTVKHMPSKYQKMLADKEEELNIK